MFCTLGGTFCGLADSLESIAHTFCGFARALCCALCSVKKLGEFLAAENVRNVHKLLVFHGFR